VLVVHDSTRRGVGLSLLRPAGRHAEKPVAPERVIHTGRECVARMSLECTHYCPRCETDRQFWKVASMETHLGKKRKWTCPECEYRFVQIGESVDSSENAA
jgi:hypothetical protein